MCPCVCLSVSLLNQEDIVCIFEDFIFVFNFPKTEGSVIACLLFSICFVEEDCMTLHIIIQIENYIITSLLCVKLLLM